MHPSVGGLHDNATLKKGRVVTPGVAPFSIGHFKGFNCHCGVVWRLVIPDSPHRKRLTRVYRVVNRILGLGPFFLKCFAAVLDPAQPCAVERPLQDRAAAIPDLVL
jgi:hypothetical protein